MGEDSVIPKASCFIAEVFDVTFLRRVGSTVRCLPQGFPWKGKVDFAGKYD